jgi:hypothetical protein
VDKLLPTLGILAVVVLVATLAILGWRRRVRRDAVVGGGYPAPAALTLTTVVEVLYVATTKGGEHLERLALPGLAFRGTGAVEVAAEGVSVRVGGEQPVFLPASALTGLGAATVAIDRVVERDGLLRLGWITIGGSSVDSYFRVVDPAGRGRLTAAIEGILPAAPQQGSTTGESGPNEWEV